jgi:MFS family permease
LQTEQQSPSEFDARVFVTGVLAAFAATVTELAGWRVVYLAGGAMTLTVRLLLLHALPSVPGAGPRLRYPELLTSMRTPYTTRRVLRVRAALALLSFAAFNVLWTPLVLRLRDPPLSLSHGVIGLFGLAPILTQRDGRTQRGVRMMDDILGDLIAHRPPWLGDNHSRVTFAALKTATSEPR